MTARATIFGYLLLMLFVESNRALDTGFWLWWHEALISIGIAFGFPVVSRAVEEWIG